LNILLQFMSIHQIYNINIKKRLKYDGTKDMNKNSFESKRKNGNR
jgi:hypothetical protein